MAGVLDGVKKGDSAYVVATRRNSAPETGYQVVTGAGPKYVTVGEDWRRTRFHRHNGYEVTDYSADKYAYRTEADYAEKAEREALTDRMRRLFSSYGPQTQFTAAQLRAVLAILEPTA